jgi:hypothetical protein
MTFLDILPSTTELYHPRACTIKHYKSIIYRKMTIFVGSQFYKTIYLNEEVNCTEPSPPVSVPCIKKRHESRKIQVYY